jgi:hypothetical protein
MVSFRFPAAEDMAGKLLAPARSLEQALYSRYFFSDFTRFSKKSKHVGESRSATPPVSEPLSRLASRFTEMLHPKKGS